MHHPPEVRFLVDRSPWPRRLGVGLGTLAAMQVGWFLLSNRTLTWQTVAVVISLLVAWGFAWFGTRGVVSSHLHWDGSQWQWSGCAGGALTLRRHLDFQTLMLVSLQSPRAPTVWLWLQRSQDPLQWLALRRAVVHATSPEPAHHAMGSAPTRHTAAP